MKIFVLVFTLAIALSGNAQPRKEIIYVGTFSMRESKGIYVFELNRNSGALKLIQTIADLESPSFLAVHPGGKFLYSVNRGPVNKGEPTGSVSAFAIDPKTGKLSLLNRVSSFGQDPCHISIDQTGNWAFISNYSEGNFVVLPVFEDGSLGGAPSDSKKYSGKSVNRLRQDHPYIHSAEISPDNQFVYVSDLGTDKIYPYRIDHQNGKITAVESGIVLSAGSGPRHMTFHPSGSHAYSAQELSSTVAVLAVDRATGVTKISRDTISSLPAGTNAINTSADIHTDPSGKFLYVSNRGLDVISVFAIAPGGDIKLIGHQKTLGKTPRNFLIDPKNKFMWVANQDSDNLVVFKINPRTGMPLPTGITVKVPAPVCVKHVVLK